MLSHSEAHVLKHGLTLEVSLWLSSGESCKSTKSSSTTCLDNLVHCNLRFLSLILHFPTSTISYNAGVDSPLRFISMASQLKYDNLQLDDHDDSSITEVEESLIGDQKQMDLEEFQQRYTTKSKRRVCISILKEARWLFEAVLMLAIMGLLLRDQSQKTNLKSSEHEVGGDLTGVGPHCKKIQEICRIEALI